MRGSAAAVALANCEERSPWTYRADMGELAAKVGPNLAADAEPAFAEREVFAEIGAVFGDHALEQGEAVIARSRGIDGMIAPVLELRVARAHLHQRLPPDHEKAGAGVADPDETAALDHGVRILDLEDVFQGGGARIGLSGLDGALHLVPVDPLDRIGGSAHVGAAFDQPNYLIRFKPDVGIDEQQVGESGSSRNCETRLARARVISASPSLKRTLRLRPR